MSLISRLFGSRTSPPRASAQADGGTLITSPQQLEEVMRGGVTSLSGASVTAETAMRVAAVFACVRLRSGPVANLPLAIKRRVDERVREDASDTAVGQLLRRKPNGWQTPSQFKRMMQAHTLLRGNGYALKVVSRGEVRALVPMHPDRVEVKQDAQGRLSYTYTMPNGSITRIPQEEVFHLVGLSMDGIRGVSPIAYARETIGLAISMQNDGARMFRNGVRTSLVLEHPGKLSPEALDHLKASVEQYRTGGDAEGRALILEEAMKVSNLAITAEDAQWIESRKFTRTDIAMFYGVPPHMLGDTEKSTSWGTGIEQQTQGFVTFCLEDDLTMWEETINRDLIPASSPDLYAKFNRAALVKGDIKTRWEAYVRGLQWGVYSPNEVRALDDMNPREGGDIYYPPPNTAGDAKQQEPGNDPSQAA